MDYISVKKLSEKYKIDFYQFISYLEYLKIPIEIENNVKAISNENIALIDKFVSTYTANQIAYMKSHDVQPFFNGVLLLDLRKKYNLNEKQFKSKCANASLEFKYVYSDEECKKIDEYINKKLNKAELREEKYIKEDWIPLRNIIDELGSKYNFSTKTTALEILEYLKIEVYKPYNSLSFINGKQKEEFEEFLKKFDSAKERKLFFQEKTCQEKYGVSNPTLTNEARNKISEKVKESCTEERQKKIEETKLKKYGKRSITDSEKSMKSRIENHGTLSVTHQYMFEELEFHSSWEVYFYIYNKYILKNNITKGKIFEYAYEGNVHRYECDFLVNGENVEIKGGQLLDENGNLKQMKTREWNMCKQKCMEENKVILVVKKDMTKIMKIVDEKYGKNYVEQFKTR